MLSLSINSFFRDVPLFASLAPDELSELLRVVTPFTRSPGAELFAQGEPSDGMYVIERGEVGVFACPDGVERVMLAELGNGAVIGELSLIDGAPRSALVETVAMTSGYFLSRDAFNELRASGSLCAYRIVLELARTLERRRRITEQRLRALIDAEEGDWTDRELRELFGRILKG